MTKKELKIIKKVCEEVRDYWEKQEGDPTLTGMCYDVSLDLQESLWCKRIDTELIEGYCSGINHFWLECKGYIIDLTASQFNKCVHWKEGTFPKILIDKMDNWIGHYEYHEITGFDYVKEKEIIK